MMLQSLAGHRKKSLATAPSTSHASLKLEPGAPAGWLIYNHNLD